MTMMSKNRVVTAVGFTLCKYHIEPDRHFSGFYFNYLSVCDVQSARGWHACEPWNSDCLAASSVQLF